MKEAAAVNAREKKIKSLLKKYTPPQRNSFQLLRQHAAAYFETRGNQEVSRASSDGAANTIRAKGRLEQDFVNSLVSFEAGNLPRASLEEQRRADVELNAAYSTARVNVPKNPVCGGQGCTVRRDGIADTQRAWMKYRDAWIAFAKTRYPDVDKNAFEWYFAKKRTAVLLKIRDGNIEYPESDDDARPRCSAPSPDRC